MPPSRSAAQKSADQPLSRKNRLQRCSACGALGHKSRTCDAKDPVLASAVRAVQKAASDVRFAASSGDYKHVAQRPETANDAVLAATALLNLAAAFSQPQRPPVVVKAAAVVPPPVLALPMTSGAAVAASPQRTTSAAAALPRWSPLSALSPSQLVMT